MAVLPNTSTRNTLTRQWEMLRQIPAKAPGITSRQLQSRLKDAGYPVSKRTIERDLIELSIIFPLTCDEESMPFNWFWAPGASVDLPGMSLSEALSLILIEDAIHPLLPVGMLNALQTRFDHARRKLQGMADMTLAARWMSKVASVRPDLNLQAPEIQPEVLETLQQALLEERQIQCRYYSAHGDKTSQLTLNPLALVQRGLITYLIGTAAPYTDVRQYAVHRFRSAEMLPSTAEGVGQFSLQAYLASDALQFGSTQKLRLRARVSNGLARLLRETPLSPDMTLEPQETGYRLEATVSDTWQLQWWILSQGDNFIVEQPASLRNNIATKLASALSGYQNVGARVGESEHG